MFLRRISCFFVVFLVAFAAAKVPSYMQICGRRNPDLDRCVFNSVQSLTDKISSGIPELDVPPLDPMYMGNIAIADLPNFKASAENVKVTGLTTFVLKNLHVDLAKMAIDVEVTFKELNVEAAYDVNARILVPVSGKGPIHTIAERVEAKAILNYKLYERDGQQYLFFTKMTIKLKIGDYKAHFTPSEGDNSPLATAINEAISSSRQEIIENMTPNFEKAISARILELANKICKHFTYEELFPDRE